MTNISFLLDKYLKSLFLGLFLAGCSAKSDPYSHLRDLQTGDFLFLDLDCGELCDAIETVTLEQFKVPGPRISHVGLVYRDAARIKVLESWPGKGVQLISLESFLGRVSAGQNQPNGYFLGILLPEARSLGEAAAQRILSQLGKKYDDVFEWKTDRFYCSELIQFGFEGSGSRLMGSLDPLFMPRPMYFGEKSSAEYKVWHDYYKNLGEDVPDQDLGISPLGIYLAGKQRLFRIDD